jgi:c-di-AMP phosphodiesterase-like protein
MSIKSIIKHPAFLFIIFGLITISALFIPNFWKFAIIAMLCIVPFVALWNLIKRKNNTTLDNFEWRTLLVLEIIGCGAIMYCGRNFLFSF